ncbi:hypothetical protein [Hyalangium rubrum]|uniref:Lipoprotein n=1 Tax=Hyalangium rubrum TaxID=3103134 RepID=A0ABU5H4A7_9BACT|nr:hypothetical protein [Hyalangium sp. s54d21]MDY7227714.1 hypothetical protein [Hyalangium sp. s54d21]
MDLLTKIFAVLKTWFYEILGVLVPGSLIAAFWPWNLFALEYLQPSEPLVFIVFAYVAGLFSQGLVDYFTRQFVPPRDSNPAYETCNLLQVQVEQLMKKKLPDVQLPRQALLGICLSHVESKREVYDKFLALRDMSRGLMGASLLAGALLLWQKRDTLTPWQSAGIAVFSVCAAVAFYNRFRSYQPAAEQALYEMFLALELKPSASVEVKPPAAGPAAAAGVSERPAPPAAR